MKTFDVQGIDLQISYDLAFSYLADPANLPAWANAFASVAGRRALMRTPNGEVEIDLKVLASKEQGTIDWQMTFPDASVAMAFSRMVPLSRLSCAYVFVLTPPPVPLEELEGAFEVQKQILAEELKRLKGILEAHA